jgi:hypothetical protein
VELWSGDAKMANPEIGDSFPGDGDPKIDYDDAGNQYVVWTLHDPAYDKTHYRINDHPLVELNGAGHIGIAAGPGGAMMVRANPSGRQLHSARFTY